MPFALPGDPSQSEISDAINYLLNNFGSNVSIDVNTGIVAGPTGGIGYLYKYLDIKYATSYDGSVGFSNSPTGATYYGSRNNNSSVESTNPADYIWTLVTGGFGTTKFIWYATSGGRQINVVASTTSPGSAYVQDAGPAIDLDVITGVSSYNAALPAIFQWTSGSSPARPTTTSTYTWSTNTFTPPSGWYTTIPSDTTPGDTLWAIYIPISASSSTATSILDWTNTSYAIVQISKNGTTGTSGTSGASGLSGASGASGASGSSGVSGTSGFSGTPSNQNAIVYLYQWSNTAPANPTATSTFTWSNATNSSYTGANGWLVYIPTNPGTPNTYLWQASRSITDLATATTTSVNWTTGVSVVSISQNGANGLSGIAGATGNKSGQASVYQWSLSTPSISGTSTYTWSTATFAPNPSGWSNTITSAPAGGYYLYTATLNFNDVSTATTTTINWTYSSIVISGYASLNGASSRICYTRIPGLVTPTSGFITTSGSTSFPTSTQSNSTWSLNYSWYGSDPNPSSTDSLYQSDGTYDPATGNSVWATPYLSSLRVGELSAITVNAGQITVSSPSTGAGYIKAGTAAYASGTMSGYGGILKQDGTFAFGNSSAGNFTFDGTNFNILGAQFKVGSASLSGSTMSGAGAVFYPSGTYAIGDSSKGYIYYDSTNINIAGTANLNVSGQAKFNGQNSSSFSIIGYGSFYYSGLGLIPSVPSVSGANNAGFLGVSTALGANLNLGLGGYAANNGIGVGGQGDVHGGYFSGNNGVTGFGTTSGVHSDGPFTTTSTAFVTNLYANYTYCSIIQATGTLLYFQNGPATGASVATFNATNKPGTLNSTNQWLEVFINGTSYQIPIWQSN
jgi:hypothetical protein